MELLYKLANKQSWCLVGKESVGTRMNYCWNGCSWIIKIWCHLCSLGSSEVCGPTEVVGFELGFNDEQDSNKKKEIWRNIPDVF